MDILRRRLFLNILSIIIHHQKNPIVDDNYKWLSDAMKNNIYELNTLKSNLQKENPHI